VYEGSVTGRFGNRKPPASAYATLAPRFAYDAENGLFLGGNFWDGRATGWKLGSPAADQAQGPFLNPLEQALPSVAELVARVCGGDYGDLFRQVWGDSACDDDESAFESIAKSIAEFEGARLISQYSSKYDLSRHGLVKLSCVEVRGLKLFKGKGKCSACHTLDGSSDGPAFTDFTFDNLGIPPNPENPFYAMVDVNPQGPNWVDIGLAEFIGTLAKDEEWRKLPHVTESLLGRSEQWLVSMIEPNLGKHRVPTLRNVDKRPTPDFVKAYGHNGYFKSLESIVHFYNTRDVLPPCEGRVTEADALAQNCWPLPEVPVNVNTTELGDLKLSPSEEQAIVAFLGTLSDGWNER